MAADGRSSFYIIVLTSIDIRYTTVQTPRIILTTFGVTKTLENRFLFSGLEDLADNQHFLSRRTGP